MNEEIMKRLGQFITLKEFRGGENKVIVPFKLRLTKKPIPFSTHIIDTKDNKFYKHDGEKYVEIPAEEYKN